MCFALVACGGSSSSHGAAASTEANNSEITSQIAESTETDSTETDSTETESTETEETSEDTPEETRESMEGEGDLGEYHVVINSAKKDVDYEGNPVIVISYTWTNNSEETTSPMGSMITQAFQDGVEIDDGILDHEYNDGMSDVRPGSSIDVDAVFNIKSDSTVEFEISAIEDMFKSPRPMVTMNFDPTTLK